MGAHRITLGDRELCVVVNDVEERFVNLADVVKERDTLDVPLLAGAEVCRLGEYQRITSDTPDVFASLTVVRIDGAEQRLEDRSSESLGGQSPLTLANEERRADQ